jgi:biofilm PGA synthesis N-glycosyltransferase PgaC
VDGSGEANIPVPEAEDRDKPNYIIISPVRNEAEYIEKTIRSMIQQTVRPVEWLIVNDGSSDETAHIVTRYMAEHTWIKLVNKEDRGTRQRGKGVVEAFYTGYEAITKDYDFIVKLDGDLSFEPSYFESLLLEFAANPKLGIAGGGVYEKLHPVDWVLTSPRDHVRGPTKVYRRTCFQEIGGLAPALGWDGVDEWKALSLGWQVQSFLEFKVFHYRVTGAATGWLKSKIEQGYGAYYMGYHPLYMITRATRHMLYRPYLIGGIVMFVSYLMAGLQGHERLPDPSLIRYIRRTQLMKLAGMLAGNPVHE